MEYKYYGPIKVKYYSSPFWWKHHPNYDQKEFVFDTLYQAVKFVGKAVYDLKYGFLATSWVSNLLIYKDKGDDVVFVDECGLNIPIWRIRLEADKLPKRISYWRKVPVYTFREGSVPGTGKRTRYGNYLRFPKTYQEIRENSFASKYDEDVKDYKVKVRRSRNYIPTAWDDQYQDFSKSWKRYRKVQWRTKK